MTTYRTSKHHWRSWIFWSWCSRGSSTWWAVYPWKPCSSSDPRPSIWTTRNPPAWRTCESWRARFSRLCLCARTSWTPSNWAPWTTETCTTGASGGPGCSCYFAGRPAARPTSPTPWRSTPGAPNKSPSALLCAGGQIFALCLKWLMRWFITPGNNGWNVSNLNYKEHCTGNSTYKLNM